MRLHWNAFRATFAFQTAAAQFYRPRKKPCRSRRHPRLWKRPLLSRHSTALEGTVPKQLRSLKSATLPYSRKSKDTGYYRSSRNLQLAQQGRSKIPVRPASLVCRSKTGQLTTLANVFVRFVGVILIRMPSGNSEM